MLQKYCYQANYIIAEENKCIQLNRIINKGESLQIYYFERDGWGSMEIAAEKQLIDLEAFQ